MKKAVLILIVIFCIIIGIMLISDEEDIRNIGTDTYIPFLKTYINLGLPIYIIFNWLPYSI